MAGPWAEPGLQATFRPADRLAALGQARSPWVSAAAVSRQQLVKQRSEPKEDVSCPSLHFVRRGSVLVFSIALFSGHPGF